MMKIQKLKKEINKYFERDEFVLFLDKNIKTILYNNKSIKKMKNSDIIDLVKEFNLYYKENKYLYKRTPYIFDYIDLDDNDDKILETFTKMFQNLDFEIIFKDNIMEFLNKMTSKIKDISIIQI